MQRKPSPQQTNPILQQRRAFEQKILAYTGNDVLSVWLEYINWFKNQMQQPPTPQEDDDFKNLLYTCITSIKNPTMYKNDLRFMRLHVTYAEKCESPAQVFQNMYNNGLGIDCALIYAAWATVHEEDNDYKEAFRIYTLGCTRQRQNANFIDLKVPLSQLFREFRDRFNQEFYLKTEKNNERPGYDKCTVYPPNSETEEYSFEELRAFLPKYAMHAGAALLQQQQQAQQIDEDMEMVDEMQDVEETNTITHVSQQQLAKATTQVFQDDDDDDDKTKTGGNSRRSIAHPSSPTVMTKSANAEIMSMFNTSLAEEDNIFEAKKKMNTAIKNKVHMQVATAPKQAIQVFQDDDEDLVTPANQPTQKWDPFADALQKENNKPRQQHPVQQQQQPVFVERVGKPTPLQQDVLEMNKTCLALFKNQTVIPIQQLDVVQALCSVIVPFLTKFDPCFFDKRNTAPPQYGNLKKVMSTLKFDDNSTFEMKQLLGQGAFAQVFLAYPQQIGTSFYPCDSALAFKIQVPANPLEYYMHKQIELRAPPALRSRFGTAKGLHLYQKESFMGMNFGEMGTLLDHINLVKQNGKTKKTMEEELIMFFTIEALKIVETLHECKIIHGDIKPDNFLFLYSGETPDTWRPHGAKGWDKNGLTLIDFGKSIDLNLLPQNVTFTGDYHTSGFAKNVLAKKQWKYSVDAIGLAGTVHAMLFGEYMNVEHKEGKWMPTQALKRYFQVSLWNNLFASLLNEEQPNLKQLREMFEHYLVQNPKKATNIKALFLKQRVSMHEHLKK